MWLQDFQFISRINFPDAVNNLIRNYWNGCTNANATSRPTSFTTSKMIINMNVLCISQFQVRTLPPPPYNPWSFALIFSPGPGDLYHRNCPGVGPIIKVPSCQLMPHEGTFQLQTVLSNYIICFWRKTLKLLSMVLKLKLEGITKE